MLLYGRNPVLEALPAGRVAEVVLARGVEDAFARQVQDLARDAGVRVRWLPRIELDQLVGTTQHQGVVAEVEELQWATVDDILDRAEASGAPLLMVLLDGVTDPRNFGAIIRSAEVLGAHGVVVEERRSAPLSPVVAKTAAGATAYLPVAQTKNLPRLIDQLKADGVWVYGAAGEAAQDVTRTDFSGKAALVIGAEGEGMRRLVREKCDVLVSIPVRGQVQSLNASVAAGILLYEMTRSRGKSGGNK
ncbi:MULTISPECIES: 23S rRNA (guanosine(2251)-2'-O)-methyltransferase RlmB [Deinococcus]|jgi:rRNA methylase, putative, group 3|uniref:RNA methyltransferase, TrmH family n=1 Tax=Deinococcus radiodurans (strain ATCC 13939 / DSM 20539 / JCM 16871 / CCUG 27074 / LMG 4051 / NBRC 15346 / NCIMB 9279 / VKM B-1422 / R1) TaxID=243230 RepID=Q9RWC1_DEIRA|nr:23S rRNA (guanosine(2251)-2'-O)-methyltransferase RlmB [Deinococcus radiodurans]AAF10325.1 RNA methyltransferase, TrmH family [Deinococcus radiodurans R1 = ATCC 13939 = DSM 20539]ANC72034.1 23S rRNA (guanosine(2251)-2'-O)-methyltransferase RlmB [Deinococcus radiodurans R1 = ATCC 13939 = DSM 20539]QEM72686.1 23S rRNA (guanosine(2251)-2'-O)-methyltransferase RlmB [Deinococcus radiodurans]QIP28886.1 23S rRNA (guanosine(2251)-2'-O)-methyltransferase RlmB [Deinococcus radiodurans]QIP32406.1 23S 